MKNIQIIISFILLFFIFAACKTETKEIPEIVENPKELINSIDVHELEIIEIDNCEYLFYKKSPSTNKGFGFMAHKGNCKNPIHYYSRSKPKQ